MRERELRESGDPVDFPLIDRPYRVPVDAFRKKTPFFSSLLNNVAATAVAEVLGENVSHFSIFLEECHDNLRSVTSGNKIRDSYTDQLGMRLHIQAVIEKLLDTLQTSPDKIVGPAKRETWN